MAGTTAHYGAQTKARKAALDILFMAEQRDASISETFAEQRSLRGGVVRELTTRIVHGVAEHQHDIDARIEDSAADGWRLSGCRRSTGTSPGWPSSSCTTPTPRRWP